MRRALAVLLLCFAGLVSAPLAWGDISNNNANNVQEGDNDTSHDQDGAANSGDAVVGQVAGVTSSGDSSLDATNRSEDVDAQSGDAAGANEVASFAGLINLGCGGTLVVSTDLLPCVEASDISNGEAINVQQGDNASDAVQAADVSSGDGIAGQVIGMVTSGTSDVVLANTSVDTDSETGDAFFNNESVQISTLLTVGGSCCVIPSFLAAY